MAVFVVLTTDAFRDTFASTASGKRNARMQQNPYGRAGAVSVRRPLRGLEIKEDTYAIIRLIQVDGTEIPLVDSGSANGQTTAYANFLLQTVQEVRMEKHQIVETFGEPYIFFFGEAPRFLDVSAVLVSSNDFNWEAEWWFNYENYLRGTRSVELGARTYLFYNDNIVEGYMLQAQSVNTAEQPLSVQLSFRLFVTNYANISFVGETSFPTRSLVNLPEGISLQDTLDTGQINDLVARGVGAGSGIQREIPIRSNISDNRDEWTGDPPMTGTDPTADRAFSEVDDLHQAALDKLADHGIEDAGPTLMKELGMGPTFLPAGTGIGFGGNGGSGATFGATANSASSGSSSSAGASFGGGTGAGASVAVGGRVTAFAVTSVRGALNVAGDARAAASASIGFGG